MHHSNTSFRCINSVISHIVIAMLQYEIIISAKIMGTFLHIIKLNS